MPAHPRSPRVRRRFAASTAASLVLALLLVGCAHRVEAGSGGSGSLREANGKCRPLSLEKDVSQGGYRVHRYTWSDGECRPRSAALVRNDRPDPGGSNGGFLRSLTWRAGAGGGRERQAVGTGVNGWNGFGYVVNHYRDTADHSRRRLGTYRVVLEGRHHAVHEYKLQMLPGGPVDTTVQWMFATGRSHPVYAITFDATPAGPDKVKADSRAPYGDFAFEGTGGEPGEISGLEWGDRFRFVTTGKGPVTTGTAWDYRAPNRVPYVRMLSSKADAEMGLVQTLPFDVLPAGGDYGGGLLADACWEKTSESAGARCQQNGETMPANWLWPFQLNQYELPSTTRSHRVAWGTSYGAVGQRAYTAFGKSLPGYPVTRYSVFVVVGERSGEATRRQVEEMARTADARLSVETGTPAGTGASPSGYDATFASWDIRATKDGKASFTLTPKEPLRAPLFRVHGLTGIQEGPRVVLDGRPARPDEEVFTSFDASTGILWLTVNRSVAGPLEVEVH